MVVRKRDGSLEPINIDKILRAITRSSAGIPGVDPGRVAVQMIGGLYNGATTQELDELSIQTASSLIEEEPNYSQVAVAMRVEFLRKEVVMQGIQSFSQAIALAHTAGLVSERLATFVKTNARKLDNAIDDSLNRNFSFAGLEGVSRTRLWRDPVSGRAQETPQYFFMRAACGPATNVRATILLYRQLAGDPNHHVILEAIHQDPILALSAPLGAIEDTQAIPFRPLAAGMGQDRSPSAPSCAGRAMGTGRTGGTWPIASPMEMLC
jgi:ribonucleoside-diphosphate reductase alpha chain